MEAWLDTDGRVRRLSHTIDLAEMMSAVEVDGELPEEMSASLGKITGKQITVIEFFDFGEPGGDAKRLPFPEASFDAVVSTLGVMFAGDQRAAAAELLRVCRPGGVIGLVNWARDGWTDNLLHTLVTLVSGGVCQCPGECGDEVAPTPFRWGSERGLRSLFPDERLARLTVTPRTACARPLRGASLSLNPRVPRA